MEFGLNTSSMSVEELNDKQPEQQKMTELSDEDMTLLSSVHCSLFIQLASSSWFHGDRALLPKVNIVWPYLLGYRIAAVLVRHCAHVLGKWLAFMLIVISDSN